MEAIINTCTHDWPIEKAATFFCFFLMAGFNCLWLALVMFGQRKASQEFSSTNAVWMTMTAGLMSFFAMFVFRSMY